ncbi:hypothetical protein CAPTEDRAFT_122278 [Capitella teleta]|uniref:G-protein coupled receptors family 1 profile domain-containing protein n=1 Tax=Capitella teleta TaxID=283909 RepID=R7UUA4_CAPTE|nr:hypothetical protein CAPTEDRAFT_122278 [Capitella teleta]|eukprot:ELU07502.1 hypothetical protein CAPTEDRAFT_122278 [Capitella teleta]
MSANLSTECSREPSASKDLPVGLRATICILIICIIFVSVLGNSIVCFIVHQKPPMRSAINLLLANMAMCHIVLSLVSLPLVFTTVISGRWMYGDLICKGTAFLHALLVCESIFVLVTISADRYLITVRRLDKLTPRRAKRLIIGSWIGSFFLVMPPCFGVAEYTFHPGWPQCTLGHYSSTGDIIYVVFFFFVLFYGPALLITPAYFAILRNVRVQMRRVTPQPEQITAIADGRLGLRLHKYCPTRVHVGVNLKARSFKTILILFITYLVCWLPYSFVMIAWIVEQKLDENAIAGSVILLLSYFNCAANPVIYCWRIRKFRDACSEIIPNSMKAITSIPKRAQRRVNPASLYVSQTSN